VKASKAEGLGLLAIAAVAFALFAQRDDLAALPDGDQRQYLAIAYHLVHHRGFSMAKDVRAEAAFPTNYREPLYPALLAALMLADGRLRHDALRCLAAHSTECEDVYRSPVSLNFALHVLAAFCTWLAARRLLAQKLWALLTFAFVACNPPLLEYAAGAWSEPLAVSLVALLGYSLLRAVETRAARWFLMVGVALGLLALTKAIFFYLVPLVCAGLLVREWRRWRRVRAALLTAVAAGALLAPWMARNLWRFGSPGLASLHRPSALLSIRAEMNRMSALEYAAAFAYWTDGAARPLRQPLLNLFPESALRRLHEKIDGAWNLESFYRRGWDSMKSRRAEKVAAGLSWQSAQAKVFHESLHDMLKQPLRYTLITLPVLYRGINGDFFWVITAPSLVFMLAFALRRWRWEIAALLLPGVFSLAFYACLTYFDPRFIATSIPALAISGGLAMEKFSGWLRAPCTPTFCSDS